MSFIATVDVTIKDLDSLRVAAVRCGLEFSERKTFRAHASDSETVCDYVLSLPGNETAYEVGIRSAGEGRYELSYDHFMGGQGLMKHIASEGNSIGAGRLLQAYALEVAKKAMRRKGFTAREVVGKNGHIKLELTR